MKVNIQSLTLCSGALMKGEGDTVAHRRCGRQHSERERYFL